MSMYVSAAFARGLFVKKKQWSHKGDSGTVLVIGGSRKYSGSPALSALAALRTGTDLVTVAAPQRAADIIASFSPDIITVPLKGDFLSGSHTNELLKLSLQHDAVVVGGGMEVNSQTRGFLEGFLNRLNRPCVIDADGIKMLGKLTGTLGKGDFILTPHRKEFSDAFGADPGDKIDSRIKTAEYFSKKSGTTILLKGNIDVISSGAKTMLNRTGNPNMTKAGTGDVLAGICGCLAVMKAPLFEAACGAAFICGAAGDLASREFGRGLFATDVIAKIPRVIGKW